MHASFMLGKEIFARIYAVVRNVPSGRVATYGEVARLAGLRGGARTVGWALAGAAADRIPWWRVVRGDGTIAPRPAAARQRRRLQREGIRFAGGRIDLRRYGWPGRRAATLSAGRALPPRGQPGCGRARPAWRRSG
ncbi:MAG TPA: MGMT family protein [bacterium]|nr:MGMT family protein [bacterium]